MNQALSINEGKENSTNNSIISSELQVQTPFQFSVYVSTALWRSYYNGVFQQWSINSVLLKKYKLAGGSSTEAGFVPSLRLLSEAVHGWNLTSYL